MSMHQTVKVFAEEIRAELEKTVEDYQQIDYLKWDTPVDILLHLDRIYEVADHQSDRETTQLYQGCAYDITNKQDLGRVSFYAPTMLKDQIKACGLERTDLCIIRYLGRVKSKSNRSYKYYHLEILQKKYLR